MSAFTAILGPKLLAVEVMAHIARGRLSGRLTFGDPPKVGGLLFKDGRPESGQNLDGAAVQGKPAVVQLMRTFALLCEGRCSFAPEVVAAGGLGIDTLGEVLLAILQTVPPGQLMAMWAARGAFKVTPPATFQKIAGAVKAVGGPELPPPLAGTPLGTLVAAADLPTQRGWAAVLVLGGLKLEGFSLPLEAPAQAQPAPPVAVASLSPMGLEIATLFNRAASQNHYEFLGVAPQADVDTIRKAYFEHAKRWHTDRLVGEKLDDVSKQRAAELFRRADEANRLLSDPVERKSYDWVLERQAAGLPTDARVVLEAEGLFYKAEGLIRRGQAAAAEPLLRQAVDMNKGEPEFWAHLGFAIYAAKGAAGADEARSCLKKAIEMRDKMDVAYEFWGRLEHSEGNIPRAEEHLEKAMELNPKNKSAERELRLLSMRREQANKPQKKAGLLDKLLKR